MKIIDLLNKIANGEEVPEKIRYNYREFNFIGGAYEDETRNDLCHYDYSCMAFLNDRVEILEVNKDKINEIIDYLDYLKSKGELLDYITNLEEQIKQVLLILKNEDGSIPDYRIIEEAIECLEKR